MHIKLKHLAILEFIIIIILLAIFTIGHSGKNKIEKPQNSSATKKQNYSGLLSPRIYSGILEPKSMLIVNFEPLEENLRDYIKKNNIDASVYVENLRDGASFGINEKKGFLPASLNKIPVAMLIMRRIEKGELNFDTMIEIKESDKSDTFGSLYKTNEKHLPLRLLLEKMLNESDNTAFNALKNYIDQKDLNFFLNYLNYYNRDASILYSVNYNYSQNKNELINTKSVYNIFSTLYLSTLLDTKDSEYILSLLTGTVFDIKKIANLPDDVIVAQKFGAEYTGNIKQFHSCGIMYINRSRIFYCIMTKDLEQKDAVSAIDYTVRLIYKYIFDIRKELDTYKS